jgi:hypothetical protein
VQAGLAWMGLAGREPLRLSLARVRNQSHCDGLEFQRFCTRLAEALARVGAAEDLDFTADPHADADVEIEGTAYLVTWAGFEQWEVYLRMHPVHETWRQWHFSGPVRILRHPRAGMPEIWVE